MVSMDTPQWRIAIKKEVKIFLDNKIWILIDSSKNRTRILGGKYIFKKKLGFNSQIFHYKTQ